jgi:hypothetical protein
VSEGFRRESDFKRVVSKVVKNLRTNEHFQPFKLLHDAVNYWSVFVPSQEDGISLLGEYEALYSEDSASGSGYLVPHAKKPDASAATWSVAEMIHEVGLPVAADPEDFLLIEDLWKARYGDKPYERAAENFGEWRALAEQPSFLGLLGTKSRVVLNECDSAFGFANYHRPSASDQGSTVVIGVAGGRRTGDARRRCS